MSHPAIPPNCVYLSVADGSLYFRPPQQDPLPVTVESPWRFVAAAVAEAAWRVEILRLYAAYREQCRGCQGLSDAEAWTEHPDVMAAEIRSHIEAWREWAR